MRNLTVAAAAFAAGMMTFAADAQEAPTLARPEAAKPKPKDSSKKTITVSIGREFHTYPVAPVAGLDEEVDKMKTGSIAGRVKPDPKATARKQASKQESARKPTKKVAAAAPARKETRRASVTASAARPKKDAGLNAPADNQDRQKIAAALAASSKKDAGKPAAADGPFHAIISRYASSYGVPVSLAHAVITVESNYRVDARGSAGEVGLMQIKPATARMMGYSGSVKDLFNPETNIKYGMKYLGMAHELGGGATCQTILKYNAGHAAKRMNPVSAAYCSKVKRQLGGS
ncbi:lytic transglycosylase domain-containing protein [Mesorhizobium sp. L-8-3]|uniref:lytic transglycosylase domain-containing protein n=1 Tax=Mesorhizobium sp. L-8-3 TaxID=2744522 RepID=UPI00192707F0|nr:lytic transglycosylase domain-containing protein [Mesorhizobium sp. L-8-3]BCH24090.1 lytic transglycosylase [Mesorhizobium sp. L-8-3]